MIRALDRWSRIHDGWRNSKDALGIKPQVEPKGLHTCWVSIFVASSQGWRFGMVLSFLSFGVVTETWGRLSWRAPIFWRG